MTVRSSTKCEYPSLICLLSRSGAERLREMKWGKALWTLHSVFPSRGPFDALGTNAGIHMTNLTQRVTSYDQHYTQELGVGRYSEWGRITGESRFTNSTIQYVALRPLGICCDDHSSSFETYKFGSEWIALFSSWCVCHRDYHATIGKWPSPSSYPNPHISDFHLVLEMLLVFYLDDPGHNLPHHALIPFCLPI